MTSGDPRLLIAHNIGNPAHDEAEAAVMDWIGARGGSSTDIEAARAELVERGVGVGQLHHFGAVDDQAPEPDPERRDYASFLPFQDPEGKGWLVQEVGYTKPAA